MIKIKNSDTIISLIPATLVAVFLPIILGAVATEAGLVWQKKWDWLFFIVFPISAFLGISTAFYISRKFLVVYQMTKFCLVGASSAVIDLGILNLLMWISGIATGPFYIIFKSLSALTSAMNGYLWNKHWTFAKKSCFFSVKEFSKFALIVSIGFLIDVSVAGFIVVIIGPRFGMSEILWANFGALIALLIASFWNFAGQKLFVFK